MRTSFLILLFCTFIFQSPGQKPETINISTSCDAVFSENADPLNPMVFHFQDQSTGQITYWQWSFGDGATTTTQNPVHTYAAGGTYFVCLTVSSADSVNICHDVLCMPITVHEPGTCISDYHYAIDPNDRLKLNFTDQSTGNINGWHWDFGDGTFSYDRNPSHTFHSFGKFRVCLTAYNVDSVSVCNDVKCDSIAITPVAVCNALFDSKLDTLNPHPNTFIFKNTSKGEPNKFIWKFDDGTFYSTRDVKHQFQSIGSHKVCLLIIREEHGQIVCIDSICQTIATAKYFNLGGHLFTGDFPINNPVATGDTGVAYLFRVDGSRLIDCDTFRFTRLGYYAFPEILNGYYIVKTELTPGSLHYSKYFPAYFPNALSWKEAVPINLSNSNAYVSDVHLILTHDPFAGPGVVKGTVLMSNAKDNFEEISFAEIVLFDAQLKPILFTLSGKSGQFELNNLPFGAYQIYVEYPGKYSRMTAIWLDATKPVIDSLRLEVFNHDVTAVSDINAPVSLVGDLFPNPSFNDFSLTIELVMASSLKFEIKSLTGYTAWSGSFHCKAGSNLLTIPARSIKPGLYLFIISSMDDSKIAVKKLLRY